MARTFKRVPKDLKQYISELEEILKKKKQGSFLMGSDVAPNAFRSPTGIRVQNVLPSSEEAGIDTGVLGATANLAEIEPLQNIIPIKMNEHGEASIIDFIGAVENEVKPIPVQSSPDGGVIMSDGTVFYEDGTYRDSVESPRQETPELLLDLGDGYGLYSDGQVRVSGYGDVTDLKSLQEAIFSGQEYYITQNYHNYYPGMGYYQDLHSGVDIAGTLDWNIPINSFFVGTVTDVSQDSGAVRHPELGYTGTTPFGNSVTIELPTGEKLKFSHLQETDLRVGDNITPGMVIGITGTTGNSTNDHLDLMYFNSEGVISDPNTFRFINEGNTQDYGTQYVGQVVGMDTLSPEMQQSVNTAIEGGILQTKIPDPLDQTNVPDELRDSIGGGDFRSSISGLLEAKGREIGMKTQGQVLPDTGVGELIRGEQGIRQTSADMAKGVGEVLGAKKDYGVSEFAGGDVSEGVAKLGGAFGLKERGISEGIAKVGATIKDKISGVLAQRNPQTEQSSQMNQTLLQQTTPEPVSENKRGLFSDSPFKQAVFEKTRGSVPQNTQQVNQMFNKNVFEASLPEGQAGGNVGAGQLMTMNLERQPTRADMAARQTLIEQPEVQPEQQIQRPKSDHELRLDFMASQGKTEANSKKYAKLARRFRELKASVPEEQWGSFTRTGYASPSVDRAVQREKAKKQAYYDSGIDAGSYDKYLSSSGFSSGLIDGLSGGGGGGGGGGSWGSEDTEKNLGQNLKGQISAVGQYLTSKPTRDSVSDYIANRMPRKTVDRLTKIEQKLKGTFKKIKSIKLFRR